MRAILLILILGILVLIVGIASGLINLNLVRGAQAPHISATGNGISAKGGQTPAFQIETGSVKVGSKDATVKVPTIGVEPAGERGQPANAVEPADNVSGM